MDATKPHADTATQAQFDAANQANEEATRRRLLGHFWRISRGFWGRKAGPTAWILTALVLGIVLIQLYVSYRINAWNRALFDALEQKNASEFIYQSLLYIPLVCASIFFAVLTVYARMSLQRRWREWLTNHAIDRWLAGGHYYHLNLVEGDHKNPEARMVDDLRFATESPVDFVSGVLSAFLSAVTFIAVLWFVGGALDIEIAGSQLHIPGFLVIAAIIYSVVASGSMVLIGRQFVRVAEQSNQSEAELRYAITRVRENGESIALIRGEPEERSALGRALGKALEYWRLMLGQWMRTTFVSHSSMLIASVVPIMLCAPKYLQGTMTLGEVMQAASAFGIVQAAFGWIVDNYPRFAYWSASARRITSLFVSIEALDHVEHKGGIKLTHDAGPDQPILRLHEVSVTLDNGTAVVQEADAVIAAGEKVLIVGESGTGKSTLLRAISGLWPWGEGEIALRKDAKLIMLPQRPYMPLGSLRRAVSYPLAPEDMKKEDVVEALEAVGLGHLKDRLDEEGPWEQTLSGGEKQRLAFARVMLHKPDLIVLDEATSALDPGSQEHLMHLTFERLPDATVISVGHRPELEVFHDRKISLEHRRGGARLIRDQNISYSAERGLAFLRRLFMGTRPAPADPRSQEETGPATAKDGAKAADASVKRDQPQPKQEAKDTKEAKETKDAKPEEPPDQSGSKSSL